ncbi:MAG: molybdate ABC transporter substrate-binding protein [Planctomycetota bacterium]|nr:molybdate ABC transporter substrate-binding protein [Planctomycetota bacterium]
MGHLRIATLALPVAVVAMLCGCGGGGDGKGVSGATGFAKEVPSKAPGKRMMIYVGAGLRPPVAEAAAVFEKKQGIAIECDYAGSELLLSRAKLSGKGDLYMPGEVHYIERAEKEGLILSKREICYFVPVMLVSKGNPKGIHKIEDMMRPGIKVGIGDARACAIGKTTAEILKKNGIPEADFEANVAFKSLTVNELAVHVKTGSLDTAIVWDGTAAQYGDSTEAVPIPLERNVISTVAAGILRSTADREAAESFLNFLCSEEVREIFRKHGYTVEKPKLGQDARSNFLPDSG